MVKERKLRLKIPQQQQQQQQLSQQQQQQHIQPPHAYYHDTMPLTQQQQQQQQQFEGHLSPYMTRTHPQSLPHQLHSMLPQPQLPPLFTLQPNQSLSMYYQQNSNIIQNQTQTLAQTLNQTQNQIQNLTQNLTQNQNQILNLDQQQQQQSQQHLQQTVVRSSSTDSGNSPSVPGKGGVSVQMLSYVPSTANGLTENGTDTA